MRASAKGEQRVQCVVIGGGLAGISTAWRLANSGIEVALVEAHRIGWGASGRNGGFVSPGFAESVFEIEERVGKTASRQMFELSRLGVAFVEERVRALSLEHLVGGQGWLKVIRHPDIEVLRRRRDRCSR